MPDAYAGSKPLSLRDDALAVLKCLRDSGHVAYFAGGCVRDLLMQREPKDYDIATDATPDRVRTLFKNTQAVGAAFGVVLVRHQQSVIEVATFRTDLEYKDGRHPTGVRFSTPEEDAARRDFTINGMFFDPITNTVIDYVGGQEDIRIKTLRAIGDPSQRFAEDHLRLLRAVRFAARFDLTVEDATADAIRRDAPKLVAISPERIGEELRMMLTPVTRVRSWELLKQFKLDSVIFRFLKLPWSAPHPEILQHRDIGLFNRLTPGSGISFSLALVGVTLEYASQRLPHLSGWQTVLADQQLTIRQMIKALRQALRLSNEEADAAEGTLRGLELLLTEPSLNVAESKRFLARPTAGASRALLDTLPGEWIESHRSEIQARLSALEKTDFAPPPFVTGDDLAAAGLHPGPAFKRILDEVYDAQLEERVTSKDEAMAMALALSMR